MSEPSLPDEGAVLVVSSAEEASRWARRVADRNSHGHRTALLVAEPDGPNVDEQAAAMASEVFRGAPWLLIDGRRSDP